MKSCLLALCFTLSLWTGVAAAKPISLRIDGGAIHLGEIRLVRDKAVYFETTSGQMLKLAMAELNSDGRRIVKKWVGKRGGTLAYASWVGTDKEHFQKLWPRTLYGSTNIQLLKNVKLSKKGVNVYESSHYRFITTDKVEMLKQERAAVLFEATYKLVMAMPINASAHYLAAGDKLPVYLFATYEAYYRAGGRKGTAGLYHPRKKAVLVPLPAFDVKWDGRKWLPSRAESNSLLAHEMTHQLCSGPSFSSWYIEGGAEYVAALRYTHGVYHLDNSRQRVFDYVREREGLDDGSGRRLGSRIPLRSLESFMRLPYVKFSGRDANKNYAVALLLTYYFYHHDGRKDGARIKAYIKAVQLGVREPEAQKLLLDGRSYEQLQEEFRGFCAQGGLSLEFPRIFRR